MRARVRPVRAQSPNQLGHAAWINSLIYLNDDPSSSTLYLFQTEKGKKTGLRSVILILGENYYVSLLCLAN